MNGRLAQRPVTTRNFRLTLALLSLLAGGCRSSATPAEPTAEPAATRPAPMLFGHRGARGLRPENTLPAFEAGLDALVDVLELDLQLTRDGELVVWHDPYIGAASCRTDGAREGAPPQPTAQGHVSFSRERPLDAAVVDPDALPLLHPALAIANQRADQLRKLHCDRNPAPDKFPAQKAPPGDYGLVTLDELFDFVERYAEDPTHSDAQRANAREVGFNIEIKRNEMYPTFVADGFDGVHPAHFERKLHEVLTRRGMLERAIVQSFDQRALWAFGALSKVPKLSVLQLDGEPAFEDWAAHGARVWSPSADLVTASRVSAAHDAGLAVVPWTVNDPKSARSLLSRGVDGLITDRPDIVRAKP